MFTQSIIFNIIVVRRRCMPEISENTCNIQTQMKEGWLSLNWWINTLFYFHLLVNVAIKKAKLIVLALAFSPWHEESEIKSLSPSKLDAVDWSWMVRLVFIDFDRGWYLWWYFWSPVLRSQWNSYSASSFLFRSFSSKKACICSTRSSSVSSSELPFFLFCEVSLSLHGAILIGQPNLLVLTQSIYRHQVHVEWSIVLYLRRYYKWRLSSFWERDCVGPPGQSWLPCRRAYLRAELGSFDLYRL